MKIVFLNCSIMTTEGLFLKKKVSLEEVKKIIDDADTILSAIGHESTATILSKLVDREIPVNRIKYEQNCNDLAIVFQLRARPHEGKILSQEEIEEIGYDFYIVKKYSDSLLPWII